MRLVSKAMRLIQVAVPVPALEALTYSVPDEMPDPIAGARVLVPLGKRTLTGIVIEPRFALRPSTDLKATVSSPKGGDSRIGNATNADVESRGTPREPPASSPDSIKPIAEVLDADAFLPPDVLRLIAWVADYYACGVGEAMAAAMPPRGFVESGRFARITEAGHARLLIERGARRRVLDALEDGDPVRVDRARASPGVLQGLERDGLIELTRPLKGAASAYRTVRVASLSAQGHEIAASDEDEPKLGVRQHEALDLLRGAPEGIDTAQLGDRGIGAATLKRLAALGLVTLSRRRVERDPFETGGANRKGGSHGSGAITRREPPAFTDEQAAAFARLSALAANDAFHTALLYGVTGSGKTEIYLRLASEVRQRGRGVLMLVPEIALTPAVAAIFRATFGERVAIQHSGLSDGERHDQWQRIRNGQVDVVVGTRSAVFAPVRSLGLIVVDEEHDGSYKQEESPRYHGRDVAIVRGRQAGALVVLGSATPSLESFHNAQTRRYELITLRRRVLDRPMADVHIVDMREEYAASGPDVILGGVLCDALRERLERKEQAIVLLNRRGFATAVFCRQCASTLECPNCSVSLTVHKAARRARCHYCNYAMALPKACIHCAGPYLEQIGFGTERVEADIVEKFEGVRVARVDRDTIRRRGAITALLSRFAAGEIDVLVGTQMLAKGHDFARVTLSRRRADVPAADAGRRAGGTRPDPRAGDRADAVPEALQHPARLPAGLRGLLPRRDDVSPRHEVSAGRRPHQHGRQSQDS